MIASLLLLIAGLLLFLVEGYFVFDVSAGLLAAITLIPALFFTLLTWLELRVVASLRAKRSGTLVGAYMLFKGVRLLLTIVAIAIYIYADAPLRIPFIVNVLILFFLALALTSIIHLRAERRDH